MPDLNLDMDYFAHPKTLRLVAIIGRGADTYPLRLWIYCGKFHAKNGSLAGYSDAEIEKILDWDGEKSVLVSALVHVGFLDGSEGKYRCHGWKERNGHLEAIKVRNRAAAKSRWDKIKRKKQVDASGMPVAPKTDVFGMPQPSVPSIPSSTGKDNIRPDSLPTVIKLFQERNYIDPDVEGEKFWNYYESNGWKVGKNPMKSWKAAAANWNTNAKQYRRSNAATRQTHSPNSQASRASFRVEDPDREIREVKESLAASRRERDQRAGVDTKQASDG